MPTDISPLSPHGAHPEKMELWRRRALRRLLLPGGGTPRGLDPNGVTPLMHAAWRGDIFATLLLSNSDSSAHDRDGWTALMYAAWQGHDAVVQTLIDAGAPLDAQSTEGWTALMYAAWQGHLEAFRHLLTAGARIDLRDREGRTVLTCIVESGHLPLLALLEV